MYLTFYGLAEKPFNPTPDPRFLYLSPGHREALAQLHYGAQERKGFIVLTGRVGTGKTTLLHALRQRLDGRTAISYIFNSALSFNAILEYALEDLGIAKREESRVRRIMALNNFLIERERAGQNTVLIIDEAQHLTPETLEQIRLLSNFETTSAKLLQILLVGQPELKAKLDLPELRQLKQRVGLRCQIPPLTPDEPPQYTRSRLRIAGASDNGIFRDSAIERITQYACGIPRVINILGDHCLLFGYADQQHRIDRTAVNHAIEYMEQGMPTRRRVRGLGGRTRSRSRWIRATSVLALAAVAAAGLLLTLEPGVLDLVRSLGMRP
jgi:general secretion pathway protein A